MTYSLVKHEKYGFYQVSPTPTDDEIAKYYSDEFYASESPAQVNDSSLDVQTKDKQFYDYWREDIYQMIHQHFSGRSVSVLDFGCGWCESLLYLKEKGMDCYGLDTTPEAIDYGRKCGLTVEVSDLKVINPFDRKFDVLLMQNVLEHLSDPVEFIQRVNDEVLNPGGLFIIDVPNEFNEFQVAGKEVHNLDEWWIAPPAHLNYFDGDSLTALVEDLGYRVVDKLSSFPLEMFLLMGKKYVGDGELGRQIHEERMLFEHNLRRTGRTKALHQFYRALADINLGRQVLLVAEKL